MAENEARGGERTPSLLVSLIPIGVLAVLLAMVIVVMGEDSMNGGSQMSMLVASAVAASLAMGLYKVRWHKIEEAVLHNIKASGISLLILLLIGAISGTWILSGVVPTMIFYGLKILHPAIFLFSCCVIAAVVSLVTGSSWTTCATLGIALMGIGYTLGFPAYWTAGAVISGAYFGDKMSPLSDTTVLASSSAGVPLFSHIRYLMYTTMPSMVIALIIYLVAGLVLDGSAIVERDDLALALESTFNISPWLLLVPLFTTVLIIKRVPVLITLFAAVVVACVAMVIAQPDILSAIGGGGDLTPAVIFKGLLTACCNDTAVETGNATLNELVVTRGMAGMLNTVWLVLTAMCFGGVLVGCNMAQTITRAMLRKVKGAVSAVAATVCSGLFFNLFTGDQYMSIILTCDLNREGFDNLGIDRRVMSRAAEDSATVLSVLIPWNSCAIAQSTVLGVATIAYFPFCFFNIISPLMSVIVAALGYKILYKKPLQK